MSLLLKFCKLFIFELYIWVQDDNFLDVFCVVNNRNADSSSWILEGGHLVVPGVRFEIINNQRTALNKK